ncbi:MAG: hypothetical protein JNK00_00290 [Flavipsychrobacter sp.]|nr:hypothetical protein [Flavipsychrobacter sp.]
MKKTLQKPEPLPVKVIDLTEYQDSIKHLQQSADKFEIKARTCALSGNILANTVHEVDTVCDALKSHIQAGIALEISQLKEDERALCESLNTTYEDVVKHFRDRLAPAKEQELIKVRENTTDKVPAIDKELIELKLQEAEEQARFDFIVVNKYHRQPPKKSIYDHKSLYLVILVLFGIIEWKLSRDAFASYGGFDRAAAAFFSVVMGATMSLCTHMFGKACYEKNRTGQIAFGIVGAIICITIILLRTKTIQ